VCRREGEGQATNARSEPERGGLRRWLQRHVIGQRFRADRPGRIDIDFRGGTGGEKRGRRVAFIEGQREGRSGIGAQAAAQTNAISGERDSERDRVAKRQPGEQGNAK